MEHLDLAIRSWVPGHNLMPFNSIAFTEQLAVWLKPSISDPSRFVVNSTALFMPVERHQELVELGFEYSGSGTYFPYSNRYPWLDGSISIIAHTFKHPKGVQIIYIVDATSGTSVVGRFYALKGDTVQNAIYGKEVFFNGIEIYNMHIYITSIKEPDMNPAEITDLKQLGTSFLVSTEDAHEITNVSPRNDVTIDYCKVLASRGWECVNRNFKCTADVNGANVVGQVYVSPKESTSLLAVTAIDDTALQDQLLYEITPFYQKQSTFKLSECDLLERALTKPTWFKPVEKLNGKIATMCSHVGCRRGDYERIMSWLVLLDLFDNVTTEQVSAYCTRLNINGVGLRLAIDFGNSNTFGMLYDHPLYGVQFAKLTVDEFWKALLMNYSLRNPEYRIKEMIDSGLIKTAKVSDIMALYNEDLKQ